MSFNSRARAPRLLLLMGLKARTFPVVFSQRLSKRMCDRWSYNALFFIEHESPSEYTQVMSLESMNRGKIMKVRPGARTVYHTRGLPMAHDDCTVVSNRTTCGTSTTMQHLQHHHLPSIQHPGPTRGRTQFPIRLYKCCTIVTLRRIFIRILPLFRKSVQLWVILKVLRR